MKTALVIENFKGKRVFAIKKVLEDGSIDKYSVISFGDHKAKCIMNHLEEIKKELEASKEGNDAPMFDAQEEIPF